MRIVLLGPPGAGKGTQAKVLAQARQVAHISTGEILREAVASASPLGLKVKAVLDRGELVQDSLMIDLIRERVGRADCQKGFVLDGFPRTVPQAEALDHLLHTLGCPLTSIVEFEVPEDEVIRRVLGRGVAEGRSDDSREVAEKRLRVYRDLTVPVSDFYRRTHRLIVINGVGSVEEVRARLEAAAR